MGIGEPAGRATEAEQRQRFVSFAKEHSPNTRYTMVFINYEDNSYLDESGFAPFGQVVVGMDVVDKLYGDTAQQRA